LSNGVSMLIAVLCVCGLTLLARAGISRVSVRAGAGGTRVRASSVLAGDHEVCGTGEPSWQAAFAAVDPPGPERGRSAPRISWTSWDVLGVSTEVRTVCPAVVGGLWSGWQAARCRTSLRFSDGGATMPASPEAIGRAGIVGDAFRWLRSSAPARKAHVRQGRPGRSLAVESISAGRRGKQVCAASEQQSSPRLL
jgi:hypothetical protein